MICSGTALFRKSVDQNVVRIRKSYVVRIEGRDAFQVVHVDKDGQPYGWSLVNLQDANRDAIAAADRNIGSISADTALQLFKAQYYASRQAKPTKAPARLAMGA